MIMLILLTRLFGGAPALPSPAVAPRPPTRSVAMDIPFTAASPAPALPQASRPGKPPARSANREGVLNSLLAPGPLIIGHRHLENDCLKCHTPGKGVPDSKCLACHHEIQADRVAHQGFHGQTQETCVQCHKDHRGRSFDSTRFDPRTFNHKLTGFPLTGKHAEIECMDCHTPLRGERSREVVHPKGVRYFGLSPSCVSCHKKDDIHHFPGKWAKEDCNACHLSARSWTTDAHFDHAKETKYALEGAHARLQCATCHQPDPGKPPRYTWDKLKERQCLACHKDHHDGNLSPHFQGGDCTRCHTQSDWRIRDFDHSVTGYKLRGRHGEISCIACHRQAAGVAGAGLPSPDFKFNGLSRDCIACHRDYHQFGALKSEILGSLQECQVCHGERSWKPAPRFDHGTDTRFPLTGGHVGVACFQCHVHDKSAPSLRIYHWAGLKAKTCELCHQSPHTHVFPPELLAKKCTDCHTASGWKVFPKKTGRFNHDTDTRFPLTGKHRMLTCVNCHRSGKNQVFRFPGEDKAFCVDCHENVHIGQFKPPFVSQACSDCHTTEGFVHRLPFKHDATGFPLKGQHATLQCAACHASTHVPFPNRPGQPKHQFLLPGVTTRDCDTCHRDPHEGTKGPNCSACHTEESWHRILDFHRNFRLVGVHTQMGCANCHGDWHSLSGMSQTCIFCHQKDDVHNHTLPRCERCHTQQVWEIITFKHSMTYFPLRGFHRTLDCNSCHAQGIYMGTPYQCVACHRAQALSFTGNPNHRLLLNVDCSQCHNQFSFQ